MDSFPPWLAFLIFLAFVALAVWLWSITPRRTDSPYGQDHTDDRP